jgi:hypothetical protein
MSFRIEILWHSCLTKKLNTINVSFLPRLTLCSHKNSGGSYRQVYLVETKPDPVVIKVMGLDGSHIGIRSVGEFLMDGVVGAAVSKNPSLVDMYGFCRYERMKNTTSSLVATGSK